MKYIIKLIKFGFFFIGDDAHTSQGFKNIIFGCANKYMLKHKIK